MQTFGQPVGQQQSVSGRCKAALRNIHDAVQVRLHCAALDGAAPIVVAEYQPHRSRARTLDGADMGQAGQFMRDACRRDFDQGDGHITAQHRVELGVHQHVNGVAPESAADHDGHGHGDTKDGEPRAQRAALHGAQHHAGARREPAAQAPGLDDAWFVDAGGGRTHGLCRGQLHGGANGLPGGQECGRQRDADGGHKQLGPHAVAQFWKAEDIGIDAGEPVPEPGAGAQPDEHTRHHDHQHQLEVVRSDDAVVVAQGLERRNLFALGGDLAAEHDVEQKGRHRQENAGQHGAHHALLLDLRVENHVRHLLIAAMGTDATIRRKQAIQAVDDLVNACLGCQPH